MVRGDLTTLEAVRQWLGLPSGATGSDGQLRGLITAVSGRILSYIQRPTLVSRTVVDRRNGSGNNQFLLKQWPVSAIESVVVGGATLPAAATLVDSGWRANLWDGDGPGEPVSVWLTNYVFLQGTMNVVVTYTAGYLVAGESHTIPMVPTPAEPLVVTVDQTYGPWSADNGVVGDDGTVYTRVTGTPSSGEYALGEAAGSYVFADADEGLGVLISYSYTPQDIAQVATEWVAERWAYRERIGQQHKSLGGQETISFNLAGMPDYVKVALQPYKSVIQLQ